ncbi:hypothetical protein [Fervidibacillus albus]|uniref:hypothetical protein n=1 Tax=Fervidibacillus albus TaxID=2980026 RepID=UPI003B848BD6
MNNMLKTIKRIAFGYQCFDYFKNRILIINYFLTIKKVSTKSKIENDPLATTPTGKARASRPRRNEVTRRLEPCHWMRVRQWMNGQLTDYILLKKVTK